jgi:hypothetical protein
MDIDIDDLLSNWYKTKQEITLLEQKCEKYKKVAEKIMCQKEKDVLKSDSYSLKKIDIVRSTISKNDVPNDIWEKYSKKSSYSSYYLSALDKDTKSVKKRKQKSP